MQELLSSIYLFLKSGHVIFMVFWLAGLFMLPRQCIYMLDHEPKSAGEAKWATRMGKLRAIILTPSMIIVWVLGLSMAWSGGWFSEGWLHAKLTLVLIMTGYHGWLVGQTKKMARGERPLTEKQLRMIGEVPGLLLVLIVVLVYLKPF
ncbi:CopD family protein [Porphyrobacter sp. ULC335]|jgi:protoporphyrinogen IX oxidase|uniref:CopD family protein n=1 Tax=Porphyrobacter sp. ULC335 TaxID=2854260 RepID=UPI002220431F|nr:CopD family protein [Porphyrobacter sp. ULC335]UYV16276.1 CopD family protein [Porphyrobacter sp. ULC335]